jgi:hypothetical protein
MKNSTSRSLVFGLVCALVGLGFGIVFSVGPTNPSFNFFWIPVVISSFTFGALFWRMLPERYARRRVLMGVIAGILGSLAAHFTTWLLTWLGTYLCNQPDCVSLVGNPPANVWELLTATALMGIISILVLGWLTSLVGGILGGLYAFFLQKRGLMG